MNVAELERFVSDADECNPYDQVSIRLAAYLARRVIAAEKLVEALKCIPLGDGGIGRMVAAYEDTK